ncbi:hypothetical protein D3C85_281190 [compost metagenome]
MSSIARWVYQNTATIWPYMGADDWNGGNLYGEPYVIAVAWGGKVEQRRDARGAEFTTMNRFWTEASSSGAAFVPVRVPGYLDRIAKGTHTGDWVDANAEEIRVVIDWEMSAFADVPDYEVVT